MKKENTLKTPKSKLPEGITPIMSLNCCYFHCNHCGELNLLSTKDGVKILHKWKKQPNPKK